jgi:TonB-dependent starch-binding outer membrane protein SusC
MKKFLLLCSAVVFALSSAWAQERTVSGKVTSSEDGSSLPGVNVVIRGTTNGTVTDADGNFKLSVPSEGGALVFSFIGLQTSEIAIGDRSVVDVSLALDITQLSEVVVTGVGVATDKKKLGISVESISSDKLPIAPTASIDQALVGKIAGAQIQSIDGTPGANINILLRGINTINRGTNPMILVDGIQMGATNLNSLDLASIDKVEVVQGAAAATIYGAQGANGVIQLFTKKGKAGQLNVDFSTSIANNQYLNIGDLRKAKLHGFNTNAGNEVVGSSGDPISFDQELLSYSENVIWNSTDPTVQISKPYDKNLKYYDHFNTFFQDANTTNNSLSISGGKDKLDYSLSVSNNHQQSNFRGDGYNDRTNFTSNIGIEIAKRLSLRSTTQLVYTKNTINYYNQQGFGGGGMIYSIFNARPFVNYDEKDLDGNYGVYYGDAAGVNQTNPNYLLQYGKTNDSKVDILQNFNLHYVFPKFVEVDLKYGINHQRQEQRYTFGNQSENKNSVEWALWYGPFNAADGNGEISVWDNNRTFQNFIANTSVVFDFDKDFNLSIPIKSITTASFDYRNDNDRSYVSYGLGLPTLDPVNASQASSYKIERDRKTEFVTYGYLINQRFEYGEIAGVSAGFRSDYSSAFGRGSDPFTFPRGDAYLRISELGFWENSGISNAILEWKFRAAYGEAGIQPRPFDRYVTLSTRTLGTSNALYFGADQSNPDLSVEVSKETEIGTDIIFEGLNGDWLSNIALSFTYWDRATDNAIYRVESAPTTGTGTVLDNAFSLASNGIQASLNATILNKGDITWNMTTNFSKQTSEIESVKGGGEVIVTSAAGSSNYVLKAGEKIGQLYGNIILTSVNQLDPDGQPFIDPTLQANYEVASNGYVVNRTTKAPYFTSGLYSFGDPNPNFNMSFINDLTFKNWLNFSFQFDWISGSHLYNQTKEWMYRDGIHSDYEKPITINGETGAWSAFYRGIYAERVRNGTKDYFYEDASFVRLRNVSVAVDFAKLFSIPKMKRLQLVLSGRNLLTFTDYTGMDPEISSGTANSSFDRGVDHNTMPNFKSYQATLNIGL